MKLFARLDGFVSRLLGTLNLTLAAVLLCALLAFASAQRPKFVEPSSQIQIEQNTQDQRLATLESQVGDLREWKSKEDDKKLESRLARLEDALDTIKNIMIGIFASLVLLLIETAHRLLQRRIDRSNTYAPD